MDRKRLEFRYFFNAGLDKDTGICDGEGCDVIKLDEQGTEQYIGSIYGVLPGDIPGMTDEALENLLAAYGMLPRLDQLTT